MLTFHLLNGLIILLFFLTGGTFASAIQCAEDRLLAGKSWVKGRSKCDSCGHELGFFDLIPIFSYLVLKGRCRYCHRQLNRNYLFGEVVLGTFFVISYMTNGFSLGTLKYCIFYLLFFANSYLVCKRLG